MLHKAMPSGLAVLLVVCLAIGMLGNLPQASSALVVMFGT